MFGGNWLDEKEQERGGEVEGREARRHEGTKGLVGNTVQLVGRTAGDQIVVFDGTPEWIGQLMPIEVVAVTPYTLHGRLAGCPAPGRAGRADVRVPLVVVG